MSLDFFRGQSYCLPANAFSSMLTYASIQSFYQYRMVDPAVSVLSNGLSKKLSEMEKDKLWNQLMTAADVSDENFIFGSLLWSWEKEIIALKMSDSTLTCDQIKGVIRWESSLIEFGSNIHKLDLLFLHIRNAFAHGRIAAVDGFLMGQITTAHCQNCLE